MSNKIRLLVSDHYLGLVLKHSTPDFSRNKFDDPEKGTSIGCIGLKLVAIIDD